MTAEKNNPIKELASNAAPATNNPAGEELLPLMVRDVNGRIYFWNSSAEARYGWPSTRAVGNVSHNLLHTIFPEPLEVINNELLSRGIWKGELIHTRADGSQVKVASRWVLSRDAQGRMCTVLEVNDNFTPVDPASAHLRSSLAAFLQKALVELLANKWWWLTPLLLAIATIALVVLTTHSSPVTLLP